ncbi:MAG: CoB--CoM heterodisulfide reductase iron-sulfur subunit A family protein [Desulfovermiculus sp.]|nr:CoB--CoM heterodisulfide reductase iron-sulfur subunit A family protein [Desulfovermiculus sp.]
MSQSILVIGGGFSGITAALEAAEVGHEVYLVEKGPYLGGRVMQLNKYFPKLCPPSCGLEIQFQRIKNNPKVKCLTLAEVVSVNGRSGDYEVSVRIKPRYTASNSANLQALADSLSQKVSNEFELGLSTRKALYMDVPFAFPQRYVLDPDHIDEEDRKKLSKSDFIDLNDQEKSITLNVGSIIVATGWKPYDVTNLTTLGAGQIQNCINNMQMERLAAPSGPTQGQILRPSDGRPPKKVAFVQCAGSRDENHLSFCSYICCMASLKQAKYLREQYPKAEATIFYIDLRTPGRYDNFAQEVLNDPMVKTVKGKVAEVEEDIRNGSVWLTAENTISGNKEQDCFDLVVLATGMQPSLAGQPLPLNVEVDEEGFVLSAETNGIFAAGCAAEPLDVMKSAQSATSAAMKAIQTVRGR